MAAGEHVLPEIGPVEADGVAGQIDLELFQLRGRNPRSTAEDGRRILPRWSIAVP